MNFKKMILAAVIAAALFLCSCSFGASIDTLLVPPSLGMEQEQIYNALQNAVGKDIKLQYPKTGDYLSAFILSDLDGDNENEALVFYTKMGLSAAENGLRINVLDQDNDTWRSVCDIPAEGAEIERVIISPIGAYADAQIVIGYSIVDQSDKGLVVYDYENGGLIKNFTAIYTILMVTVCRNYLYCKQIHQHQVQRQRYMFPMSKNSFEKHSLLLEAAVLDSVKCSIQNVMTVQRQFMPICLPALLLCRLNFLALTEQN